MLLIRNVRLIDALTEGFEGQMADILVKGNRINKIDVAGSISVDQDVEVIEGDGRTLLPGFWDLHAHLSFRTPTANTDSMMNNIGEELFGCYDYARLYLEHGYTSVRDCGSAYETVIYLRDAIEKGYMKGPRLLTSGLIISPTTKGNKMFPAIYAEADSPDEVRKAARIELEKGADFVKYMATGAFMNKGGEPGNQIATKEELMAAQEVAVMNNTYVAVHAHNANAIEMCIDAGIRTIEHASFMTDKAIEALKDSETSFIVPTYSVAYMFLRATEKVGVTEFFGDNKRQLTLDGFESLTKSYEAGVKMGWGSDIGMYDLTENPGLEFIARKEVSKMDNIDMLLQATKYSAEIAGFGDEVGTIKEGKIADIILMDGKPDEDIEALKKLPVCVIRDGEKLI